MGLKLEKSKYCTDLSRRQTVAMPIFKSLGLIGPDNFHPILFSQIKMIPIESYLACFTSSDRGGFKRAILLVYPLIFNSLSITFTLIPRGSEYFVGQFKVGKLTIWWRWVDKKFYFLRFGPTENWKPATGAVRYDVISAHGAEYLSIANTEMSSYFFFFFLISVIAFD